MKKIILLSLIIPLILYSCEIIPDASFSVDNATPDVGAEVFFTNSSFNAERFEWDFGDGTTSHEVDPIHIYTGTGSYQVELAAYSKTGLSAKAHMTIDVMIPTLLEVEVLEYFNKYPVNNASVIVYRTLADWDEEKNSISEAITDAEGKGVFSGLEKNVYFLDVWEKNHNNYALRDEDVAFIRTDQIRLHEINRFVAFVDYVPTKGDGTRDRKMVIKSLVKRTAATVK
jgi:hypothetical protein